MNSGDPIPVWFIRLSSFFKTIYSQGMSILNVQQAHNDLSTQENLKKCILLKRFPNNKLLLNSLRMIESLLNCFGSNFA